MLDFFAGIGGFRLIANKYNYKCLGYSEINKLAKDYYQKNYNEYELDLGDITKIEENPFKEKIDLITAGVPCQSWSIAGKNKGFNDERGKLWFHTFRMLDIFKPNKFIFENVKGLHDPRNKEALNLIISNIEKRNYFYKILLLNANEYGSAQIRTRIFIIGFNNKRDYLKFNELDLDYKKEKAPNLNHLLNLKAKNINKTKKYIFTDVRGGENTIHSWDLVETSKSEKNICNLLLKNRRKKKYGIKDGNPLSLKDFQKLDQNVNLNDIQSLINKKILRKVEKKYDFVNSKISSGINGIYRIYSPSSTEFSTITASNQNDYIALDSWNSKNDFLNRVMKNNLYRKPTKEELLKIQSFPEKFILPEKRSSFQKLIGNSVPLNLIELLIRNL